MLTWTYYFGILALMLIFIRLLLFHQRRQGRKLPPGPAVYPLVGCIPSLLPYLRFYGSKKFLTCGQELVRNYGDVIQLDFGFLKIVLVTRFEAMQHLKGKHFLERPHLGILEKQRGLGISMNSGRNFMEQRAFAVKTLKDFKVGEASLESEIRDAALQIIEHFKRKSAGTKTGIDPEEILSLATRKTMMRILVGVDLPLDDPSLKTLEQLNLGHLILERQQTLCLAFPTLAKMFPRFSGYESLEKALDTAHANIEQHVKEHQVKRARVKSEVNLPAGEKIPVKDFIDSYLAHMDKMGGDDENSSFHGEKGVKNLTMTLSDLFVASTDSSKLTVLYALLYLAHFPQVKQRVQAEIDEVVGPGRTPSLADRLRMPYTEAVIAETLRKHSQAIIGFPRLAAHDTEMNGYLIEKGTMIVPWYYGTHFDQTLWGPDSSVKDFNPHRFLRWDESLGKEVLSKSKYLIPFGVGNRSCPGKPIAGIIIFLYLTSILQRLDFCFDDNEPKPSLEPIVTTTLVPPPYKLIFSNRDNIA